MSKYILGILFLINFGTITAQVDNAIPRTFLIGENEDYYEQLVKDHNVLLLNVCSNSMEKAYSNWVTIMTDLEDYAEDRSFDLKGTKIWINVFWNTDGSIKHIVYYPKPTSKNMDFDLLSSFLSDFCASYQFELNYEKPFSHYGSASFPTMSSIAVDR